MSRSLQLGLAAVPPEAEAAVILLGDQPTVTVEHLRQLDAWRGGTPIVATRSDGVLGPPALIEREGFELANGLSGDVGLRELLRTDPTLVTAVDADADPGRRHAAPTSSASRSRARAAGRATCRMSSTRRTRTSAHLPACWATFGEVLAREFGDPAFGRVHRHTVDVYAVQHPGTDDRRQRQSVALHLIGLCHWLEHGLEMERLNAITQRLADADRDWPWLDPPAGYPMTVVDLLAARDGAEHVQARASVGADARWEAWSRSSADRPRLGSGGARVTKGLLAALLLTSAGCSLFPPAFECDDTNWEPGQTCERVLEAARGELAPSGHHRPCSRRGKGSLPTGSAGCPFTPFVVTLSCGLVRRAPTLCHRSTSRAMAA